MSLQWVKAKKCTNGSCVETLKTDREIFLRDSKRPDVVLFLSFEDWEIFKQGIKEGDFD